MKTLSNDEINSWLKKHENWNLKDDEISCVFTFKDFYQAMGFMVQLGIKAEKHNHHPKIQNVYNVVTISMTTHDAGNKITDKDTKLAEEIENLNIYDASEGSVG
jgi:4a-hydroxytetrahydrobiopterin dehydratase